MESCSTQAVLPLVGLAAGNDVVAAAVRGGKSAWRHVKVNRS
ncbi:MAG: hypothetical protein ACQESR_11490 [Planctomycetota bacterium]